MRDVSKEFCICEVASVANPNQTRSRSRDMFQTSMENFICRELCLYFLEHYTVMAGRLSAQIVQASTNISNIARRRDSHFPLDTEEDRPTKWQKHEHRSPAILEPVTEIT